MYKYYGNNKNKKVEIKQKIYPAPCSMPIFSLKSTEFKLAGFHFKTTSH